MSRHAWTIAEISIHALHEESDYRRKLGGVGYHISIHALHEESDLRSPRARTRR